MTSPFDIASVFNDLRFLDRFAPYIVASEEDTRGAPVSADSGTAHGTLTVGGKTTPLAYAYARTQRGFFDKSKEDVLVILCDVPIQEAALEDQFARNHMAEEGKLHAVEVVLNSEKQAASSEAVSRGPILVAVGSRCRPAA